MNDNIKDFFRYLDAIVPEDFITEVESFEGTPPNLISGISEGPNVNASPAKKDFSHIQSVSDDGEFPLELEAFPKQDPPKKSLAKALMDIEKSL